MKFRGIFLSILPAVLSLLVVACDMVTETAVNFPNGNWNVSAEPDFSATVYYADGSQATFALPVSGEPSGSFFTIPTQVNLTAVEASDAGNTVLETDLAFVPDGMAKTTSGSGPQEYKSSVLKTWQATIDQTTCVTTFQSAIGIDWDPKTSTQATFVEFLNVVFDPTSCAQLPKQIFQARQYDAFTDPFWGPFVDNWVLNDAEPTAPTRILILGSWAATYLH